jgi:hypothetical protein
VILAGRANYVTNCLIIFSSFLSHGCQHKDFLLARNIFSVHKATKEMTENQYQVYFGHWGLALELKRDQIKVTSDAVFSPNVLWLGLQMLKITAPLPQILQTQQERCDHQVDT